MAQLTFFICGLTFISYFNLRRVAMHDQNTQMLLFQALDASLIHETSMCTYYLFSNTGVFTFKFVFYKAIRLFRFRCS